MKLLSLDPASKKTGFAVWETDGTSGTELLDYGLISHQGRLMNRLMRLSDDIDRLLADNQIEQAVMEKPVRNYNQTYPNSDSYLSACKVVRELLEDRLGKKNVFGVNVQTWKGSGKKKDTIRIVNLVWKLELTEKDDDIADAIKLGEWFIKRQRFNPLPPLGEATQ